MFDIVTIGTASRDIFLQSKLFRIVRDPEHLKKIGFVTGEAECFAFGGKVEVDDLAVTTGGGAANAAVTFARQGFKTAAVVKLGWQDEAARSILRDLKREGVQPLALFCKGTETASSVILLSSNGERTILVFRGASEGLETKEISEEATRTQWVYVVAGTIPHKTLEKMFVRFGKNVRIVFAPSQRIVQMGVRQSAPLFGRADVVLMNREEAALLTGVDFKKESEIFNRLDAVVSGIVVMTDGPRGVTVSDGKILHKSGVFRERKLVDRTGSGDAFGSGFVAALIRSDSTLHAKRSTLIQEAIRLGSANATSVVEHIGAQAGILTKRQFENERRWKNLSIRVQRLH